MNTNINAVLDKHKKKTQKEFTLTGRAVSVIGPRVVVDVGGQRYDCINTRGMISVGDGCSISRGTNNRKWRVVDVFGDPQRGNSMARQDMYGNGELPAIAVDVTAHPTITFPAAGLTTWVDVAPALFISIKRPRIMATFGFEVRNTTVSGYVIYFFRFSADDDTYLAGPTGGYTSISTGGSHTITNTISVPIVDLPPGIREVTPQLYIAMTNSGNQIQIWPRFFHLHEI